MRLLILSLLLAVAAPALASPDAPSCGSQKDRPAADRVANTLRWTTASEQDNFGYDIYRGAAEDGPFSKLTTRPILGHGTTDETNDYSYRDDAIDPCKAYWYYVESISTSGERERFTPIFKADRKRQPAALADSRGD